MQRSERNRSCSAGKSKAESRRRAGARGPRARCTATAAGDADVDDLLLSLTRPLSLVARSDLVRGAGIATRGDGEACACTRTELRMRVLSLTLAPPVLSGKNELKSELQWQRRRKKKKKVGRLSHSPNTRALSSLSLSRLVNSSKKMALRALASRSATSGVAVTAAAGRRASLAAPAAVSPAVQRLQYRRSRSSGISVVASVAASK